MISTVLSAVHVFEHQGEMKCHRESQSINPAVCVDTLWLRKDLITIQYGIDVIATITFKGITLYICFWLYRLTLSPPFILLQVHAKPISQMRTSCIIFSWQCLLVRETSSVCPLLCSYTNNRFNSFRTSN